MGSLKEIFLTVFNMSVTAGVAVLLVLGVRFLIRKAPKSMSYLLWGIVGFRLICPYSLPSAVSIFNLEVFQNHAVAEDTVVWNFTGMEPDLQPSAGSQSVNTQNRNNQNVSSQTTDIQGEAEASDTLTQAKSGTVSAAAAGKLDKTAVLAVIWVSGIVIFLAYEAAAYLRLKKRVAQAVISGRSIYECDNIEVPFVMGIMRPRIYLPFRVEEKEREYILLHERYHIRRKDYLIKAGALMMLILHWFNPLVWAAYHFMCVDMEMSCDEKVIGILGRDMRSSYSSSLLSFAAPRRMTAAGHLAFGETSVKSRIKNVLNFKKPGKAAVGAAMVVCILTAALITGNAQSRTSLRYEGKEPVNPGAGFELSYNVEQKMQSFLFYREVYEMGELIDYKVVCSGAFGDGDDSWKRSGRIEVGRSFQKEEIGMSAALHWNVNGRQDSDTLKIQKYGRWSVTENYLVGEEIKKKEIQAEEDFVVAAWHLGTRGNTTKQVPCSEFDQRTRSKSVWNTNDGEILYRMVVSELGSEELLEKYETAPQVKELFEAKNPYIGDAPANGKLLELLNVGRLGEYTTELQTSEEPYILTIHFENEPADQTGFNWSMEEKAVLLLALIDNAGEVQWTYPVENGDKRTEYRWKYDRTQAEERMEVDNIKECARTLTSLEALLDKMKEPYVRYEDIHMSGEYYLAPDGTKYQYSMYLHGMPPDADFAVMYNILTNDENLTFEEAAQSQDSYVIKEVNKYVSDK